MGEGSAACRWTYFEKRNFMGIELDVLVGHPEHDLLFVVSQVARAAGLKAVYNVPFTFKRLKANAGVKWVTLGDLTNHVRGPRGGCPTGLLYGSTRCLWP